ncbi:MAG TPA: tripartite tricarboxylate transporter substrate binding protein [Bordetella sp.]
MKLLSFRMSSRLLATATALGALSLGPAAQAQSSYPSKPIRLVVPFPPGGAVDMLGRLVGQHIGQQMNQSVIVENRGGANGRIGDVYAAHAAPDGYTLLFGANGLATNPSLYPNDSFSEIKTLTPVAYLGSSPLIMVVPQDSPAKSLKDIIDAAKADPSKIAFASAGNGSSAHLGSEMLKSVAKVSMLHVPYKGGAPAIIDLTAGRVSFMLLDPPQAMPQIRGNKLRPLVVGSNTRLPLLPDVPSAADAGYPDFEATVWWGFMAPKGTPPEIVDKLNSEINTALRSPDVQKVLGDLGVITKPGTPAEFGQFIQSQYSKWNALIKQAGITAEN